MSNEKEIAETLERLAKAAARAKLADARDVAADVRDDIADARDAVADVRDAAADVRDLATTARMDEADRQTDLASLDSDEYHRALHHYTQLVRHRIANPLQIIAGMAETLLHRKDLDPEMRREMLATIEEQAHVLERLSLFLPELQSVEETDLHPRPYE